MKAYASVLSCLLLAACGSLGCAQQQAERHRLEERLRQETRRADDLAQKLDALKAIEKNLLDRSQPSAPNKRP